MPATVPANESGRQARRRELRAAHHAGLGLGQSSDLVWNLHVQQSLPASVSPASESGDLWMTTAELREVWMEAAPSTGLTPAQAD